ncbi:MAG: hypothetical protein HZR80_18990 [Candidatus Heimdallarchaeota archaeon]
MSSTTKSKAKFQWDEEELIIKNLRITDSKVLDFIQDVDKKDYEYILTRAIEIGIRVMGEQKTYDKVDYVDKAFQNLTTHIDDQLEGLQEVLDGYFGEEGEIAKITDSEEGLPAKVTEYVLDEEKGLRAYLDPHNQISPIYRLKEDLLKGMREIREAVITEDARAEVMEKTTIKGRAFEKELYDFLYGVSKNFGDVVEHIGDKPSERGKKAGDLLIGVRDSILGDIELLMVVEAKDSDYKSSTKEKELIDEVGNAIINRSASIGIGIVKKKSSLSKNIGTFRFFEPNIIICCAEEPTAVELAYRFARSAIITRHLSQDYKQVEWENVKNFAQYIENSLRKIDTARSDLKTLNTSIKRINTILEDYADDVKEGIKKMMQAIDEKVKEG